MKNYPTFNQIFAEKREKYISLVTKQLEEKQICDVVFWGDLLRIDFRKIFISELYKHGRERGSLPVILLQGYGSGWEGIVSLAFSLACEGYEIFLISLPGYGNSETPPKEFFQHNYFLSAASVIKQFCYRSDFSHFFSHGAYLVGHSMGAQVLAEVAKEFPYLVKKLVLINPSGAKPYGFLSKLDLERRFVSSGIKTRREYQKLLKASGETDYMQPLIDWCRQQKNPFSPDLIRQRLAEFRAICQGNLLETLRQSNVPKYFLFGAEDSVFPIKRGPVVKTGAISLQQKDGFTDLDLVSINGHAMRDSEVSLIMGLSHNPTLYHSEITAAAIAHYLEKS